MKSYTDFTEGRVFLPLMRFAIPLLGALFLQSMYSAIDILILGKFTDAVNVSAVSTGSFIMATLTFIIVGMASGTTILLGNRIGQKRFDEAGDVVGASICLFVILSAVITIVMPIAAGAVSRLMQVPTEAIVPCTQYIRICCFGAVFICGYNILGAVFRGIGDSRTPLLAVAIAGVLNVAGDLLFVVVIQWGAAGAALATVIAQALSLMICLVIIHFRQLPFAFSRRNIRFDRAIISRVVGLGFPIALQDLLVSISFLVVTAIINRLGVIASAGVGVAEKVCAFIMLVPSAYMQSVSAFVAQNVGAGNYHRAHKALIYGIGSSLAAGAVIGIVTFFRGDLMAAIFTNDSDVVRIAHDYLRAYSIDCLLVSFLFCFLGYFNGCSRTQFIMWQGIIGAFCVRIPVSYLMSQITPVSVFFIGLATPSATIVQICLCVVYFIIVARKHHHIMS